MRQRHMLLIVLFGLLFLRLAFAGDRGGRKDSDAIPVVTNETYINNCGSCHFAYQPGLLPARSWVKVMDGSGGHPGGNVSINKKDAAEIVTYLTQNSAEQSPSKRSKKILKSVGSDTPVRISEISYIKKKHREIHQDVFMRKAIGSRANCAVCHISAASGEYDDDDVVIPK